MRGLKAQSAHNHPILNAPREGNPLLGYADDIHTCMREVPEGTPGAVYDPAAGVWRCNEHSYRARYDCRSCREVALPTDETHACAACGQHFQPTVHKTFQRFCSKRCKNRAHNEASKEFNPKCPGGIVPFDATRVRALLEVRGVSQIAASIACDMDSSWVGKLLARKRASRIPLEKLARLLGVEPDYIMPSNGSSETWKGTSAAVHGGRDGAESPSRLN